MSKTIKTGGFRHGLHALISLFTCGVWLPGWLVCWVLWLLVGSKKTKITLD